MSAKPSNETSPAFSVSPDSRVRLPLMLLWSIVLTSILVGGYVYTLRAEVAQHTVDIKTLQEETRASRELLVRIDENVKELKGRVR